jgi:hypothetical protein
VSAVTRRPGIAAALVVVLGAALASCGHSTVKGPTVVTTTTRTATAPQPTRTLLRNYRTYRAGQTGVLQSRSQHASLLMRVSKPTTSTSRLSSSYGYPPANGHYVTFVITVKNSGQVPVLLQRLDFFVRTPGKAKTTTDEGNAPFSGSGTQLDTTQLVPGKRVTNNLTFDVAQPTGTLFYAPNGDKSIAWTF